MINVKTCAVTLAVIAQGKAVGYKNTISKQTTIAKKATPSIRAAEMIMLERISLLASG